MKDPEQKVQIDRVRAAIAEAVHSFCLRVSKTNSACFFMSELTEHVKARTNIAPDSAGRILRDLRQQKQIDYKVINRARSLYMITMVKP